MELWWLAMVATAEKNNKANATAAEAVMRVMVRRRVMVEGFVVVVV